MLNTYLIASLTKVNINIPNISEKPTSHHVVEIKRSLQQANKSYGVKFQSKVLSTSATKKS